MADPNFTPWGDALEDAASTRRTLDPLRFVRTPTGNQPPPLRSMAGNAKSSSARPTSSIFNFGGGAAKTTRATAAPLTATNAAGVAGGALTAAYASAYGKENAPKVMPHANQHDRLKQPSLQSRINAGMPAPGAGRTNASTLQDENANLKQKLDAMQMALDEKLAVDNTPKTPYDNGAGANAYASAKASVRLLSTPPLRVPVNDQNAAVMSGGDLVESEDSAEASRTSGMPQRSVDELRDTVAGLKAKLANATKVDEQAEVKDEIAPVAVETSVPPTEQVGENEDIERAILEEVVGETSAHEEEQVELNEEQVYEPEEEEEEKAPSAAASLDAASVARPPKQLDATADPTPLTPNTMQRTVDRAAEIAAAAAASDAAAKERVRQLETKVQELAALLEPAKKDADNARSVITELQGRIDLLMKQDSKQPRKMSERLRATFTEQHVKALELAMSETREELQHEKEMRERERERYDEMMKSLREERETLMSAKEELDEELKQLDEEMKKKEAVADEATERYSVEQRRRAEVEHREEELAVQLRRLERKLRGTKKGDQMVQWALRPATRSPGGQIMETPLNASAATSLVSKQETHSPSVVKAGSRLDSDELREGASVAIKSVDSATARTSALRGAEAESQISCSVNTGATGISKSAFSETATALTEATVATVTSVATATSSLASAGTHVAKRWGSFLLRVASKKAGETGDLAKAVGGHVKEGARWVAEKAQDTRENVKNFTSEKPGVLQNVKAALATITVVGLLKIADGKRKASMRRRRRARLQAKRREAAARAAASAPPPPPSVPPPPTPPSSSA